MFCMLVPHQNIPRQLFIVNWVRNRVACVAPYHHRSVRHKAWKKIFCSRGQRTDFGWQTSLCIAFATTLYYMERGSVEEDEIQVRNEGTQGETWITVFLMFAVNTDHLVFWHPMQCVKLNPSSAEQNNHTNLLCMSVMGKSGGESGNRCLHYFFLCMKICSAPHRWSSYHLSENTLMVQKLSELWQYCYFSMKLPVYRHIFTWVINI